MWPFTKSTNKKKKLTAAEKEAIDNETQHLSPQSTPYQHLDAILFDLKRFQ